MSEVAITVEHLSKRYRIGEREGYKALRDVISDGVSSPFRKLRAAFSNGNGVDTNGNGAIASDPTLSAQPFALNSPSSTLQTRKTKYDTQNSFWALDDVSFEVKRGEVVGIIGRNGAGKSTLLKILSRITKPTKGHAKIHGRVGSLLEVGTGFHPELSGRENIYLNAAILGMRKVEVERKFDEIVAFAEVEKFIDTPVKRYSSGMYVRLAFAVAAHMETEVLLVDEVLAVGDAKFQNKCLGKMDEVARQGRTVIFVSHDMTAIQVLCRRVIHLEQGRLIGTGEPNDQIGKYLSARTRNEKIIAERPLALSSNLEIRRFEFSPNPVTSGEAVEFEIELSASEPVSLHEMAILIYSGLGRRLAIIDLRQPSRSYELNGNVPEFISGRINCLPLIEGEYQIGLYLNWADKVKDFSDLLTLKVSSRAANGDIVPYHSSVRGVIELDYRVF